MLKKPKWRMERDPQRHQRLPLKQWCPLKNKIANISWILTMMEITTKSLILVGFSGEAKATVGEIKLPVYIKGVKSMPRFCIIDSLSCYNIILGRPWIHDMKAVPSTYHQCVKLPTPWGVVKINSDQQEAKECYSSSMKGTTKP
ncbi:hypothetical protein E3N88_32782 [Mikania micrantha]|uniref:Uncharacterized protein n=1 Tax=Mikania micrantha TaxID=192012 RepID=A0A5N6M9Y9_9ASTR|nr:hypothetical protein E3N88_32782 [Mikania micrantha]